MNPEHKRLTGRIALHGSLLLMLCACMMLAVYLKSGQLAYPCPLDDSYLHLSIARTLAGHGHFSVDPSRADFSSSSPLFSFGLAAIFRLFGPSLWWSFILSIVPGVILVGILSLRRLPAVWIWAVLLLGPVPLLMIMGMEHSWQVLLGVLWVARWANSLDQPPIFRMPWQMVILSAALVLIRYEGLFLVAGAAFWHVTRKEFSRAASLLLAGAIPVILIGAWSVWQGGTFLPLSLLVKGSGPDATLGSVAVWIQQIIEKIYDHPYILAALTISLAGWLMGGYFRESTRAMAALLQVSSWLHLLLAALGGFRYDALIIVLHLLLLAKMASEYRKSLNWRHWLAAGWLAFPLLVRTAFFAANYPLFVTNIYQQSIQVAKFVHSVNPEASVAMHDIGAVSWLNEVQLTDLAFIGDQEMYRLYKSGQLSPETAGTILDQRNVEMIIIQPEWAGHLVPQGWKQAGSWHIPDPLIVPYGEVGFWARNGEEAGNLAEQLSAFSAFLPPEVRVEIKD